MHRLTYWLLALIPYLVLMGLFGLRLADPDFIQSVRLKTFDFYQRTWPRESTNAPVFVIDIDEKSLAEVGQWPWPRSVLAKMVESAFEKNGIKTLAFDVVFAESDRTSPQVVSKNWNIPPHLQTEINNLPDHDNILAETIAKYPVVVGYAFNYSNDVPMQEDFTPKVSVNIVGHNAPPRVIEGRDVIRNLKKLEDAAAGMGYFSFNPAEDGVVRRPPLLTSYNGHAFPILGLEALRLWKDTRSLVAAMNSDGEITGFKIKDLTLPTDANGNFWIRYRELDTRKYISASDVLFDRVPKGLLEGSIAFVGTSAAGLLDMRATPVHQSMPGVDVHAQMVENILDKQFLNRDYRADTYEQLFSLIVGILLILVVERFGAVVGGMAVFSVLSVIGFMSIQAFRHMHMLVDVVYPSLTIIGVYMVHNVLKYAREESQRKAIRHAFSHYLSGDLVNALTSSPDQLTLGGEQKHMTMLFSDIRGFTTLSEGLTPQELTQLLNEYLTPMTDIILTHKGTIDKYMGDAIMAFWNAPLNIPNHEQLACQSALDMLTKLGELNTAWTAEGRPNIDMGLGIHCGQVTVGNMGSTQRFDYTVLGDAVNLASRLESLCKFYGVRLIISGDVKDKLLNPICVPLDLVAVKGKTEPVEIYELIAIDNTDPTLQATADVSANAMAAYRAQDWDKAALYFEALKGHDVLKALYAERMAAFRKTPPPKDWDGVYIAKTK